MTTETAMLKYADLRGGYLSLDWEFTHIRRWQYWETFTFVKQTHGTFFVEDAHSLQKPLISGERIKAAIFAGRVRNEFCHH